METNHPYQDKVDNLRKLLDQVKGYTIEALAREDLLELNLSDGLVYFQGILNLAHRLSAIQLEDLPPRRLDDIASHVTNFVELFSRARQLSVREENPSNARNRIILDAQSKYNDAFSVLSPIIAFGEISLLNLEGLKRQADETTRLMAQKLQDEISGQLFGKVEALERLRSETEQLKVDLKGLLESASKVAQEIGATHHAKNFETIAGEHKSAARKWLVLTSGLGVLTLAVAVVSLVFYVEDVKDWTLAQSIQLAISKVVVFAILFFGLLGSARVYRAHRHNEVVNKHRQNALVTFETFVKGATDPAIKQAVLLECTRCIFAPQHTGYISHEPEAGMSPMLEIIRGVAEGQGKN